MLDKSIAAHVHIGTGIESIDSSLILGAHAVAYILIDCAVVGDEEALEAPLVAQDVGQQPFVLRRALPLNEIEATPALTAAL